MKSRKLGTGRDKSHGDHVKRFAQKGWRQADGERAGVGCDKD